MAAGRFQFRAGPFVHRVRASIRPLPEVARELYRDFPLADDAPLCDFHVSLLSPLGARGWLLREVDFYLGGHFRFDPFQRRLIVPYFEWGLNWCVANHAHQYLLLHAASLERDGRALLLTAPSGGGKSTLAAALALIGWRLLSDEFAMLDDDARLIALARPVSLKNEAIELIRERANGAYLGPVARSPRKGKLAHLRPPVESARRVAERARPGWVVLLRYQPAAPLALESVSKGQTMLELAAGAFNYGIQGRRGFELLSRLVDQSECLRLTYGDLDAATALFNGSDFARP